MSPSPDNYLSEFTSESTARSEALSPSATGPTWPGIDAVKYLFVFGDSYSSVGYQGRMIKKSPHPSVEEPLGIKFPGFTWTDDRDGSCIGTMGLSKSPNWVGHLVTSRKEAGHPLIVYDYAVGGHTVPYVEKQITKTFASHVQVASQPKWKANDSLFAIWVGINDCAGLDALEPIVERLFEAINFLYEKGTRNFLLIDVPPIDKSPAIPDSILKFKPELAETYREWNAILRQKAKAWQEDASHEDCTVLIYSSYDLFVKVTEEPQVFDFPPEDVKKEGGSMWMDRLHPTSKMHKVIADDIEEFLKGHLPHQATETSVMPVEAPA